MKRQQNRDPEMNSNHIGPSNIIATEEGLAEIIGRPGPRVLAKVIDRLDGICRAFIARSPFVIIASHDAEGRTDVSPKGDPPGFVHVLDDRTLAIPERPGNRRADTFHNVLQQSRVGLIFLVPGKAETLRISGTARVVHDASLCERMAVAGRVPVLALVVTLEEAFMHCTKCMVRSRLWQPDTWNPEGLASIGEAMVVHGRLDMLVADMRAIAEKDERERLY